MNTIKEEDEGTIKQLLDTSRRKESTKNLFANEQETSITLKDNDSKYS